MGGLWLDHSLPFPDRMLLPLQPLILILCFFLLHPSKAVPALPSQSAVQSQSKPVPGQTFAGDQLPPELQKAPIVQPSPTSSPSRFVASFSGYSFDYSPEKARSWAQSGFKSSPSPSVYDQPEATASPPPPPPPRPDAFLLRPSPAEQFLPRPSLPSKSPNELARFLPPVNSQKPTLTGWVLGIHEPPERLRQPFPGGGAIVDPAAYFMEGADLGKVCAPRCSLIGCKGPVANDFDFQLEQEMPTGMEDRACHRTFVALNGGCLEGRGYPIGMVCSICCECSTELAGEMRKSRGWLQNYRSP